MKALRFSKFGPPSVLAIEEVPRPEPRDGEALIQVKAAAINPSDVKNVSGHFPGTTLPRTPGRDFSGIVSGVGEGVSDLRVGDAVFAVCDVGQEGAYAEKIAIKATIVAKKPASLSHVDATAMALAGLTALVAVEDTLKLQAGETILIQGGAGGVAWSRRSSSRGMWQRMVWPGSTSASGGSSRSQISPIFRGHRVWKTQPEGGSAALGISPSRRIRGRSSPSSAGTADRSASVYGWCGAVNTVAASPTSMMRPR